MHKNLSLWLASGLSSLLCFNLSLNAQSPPPAEKPNVLFIMVDDLNELVGFMNENPQSVTPNMDRLASRGTVFLNAHCSSPQCAPSRASLLSGKLPDYTGIYEGGAYENSNFRGNFLGQPVFTLPEVLKDSGGYFTAGVRKIFHTRNHNLPNSDADLDESTSDECARGKSWSRWINSSGADVEPYPADRFGWNDNYEWGAYPSSQESLSADFRATTNAVNFLQAYSANPGNFCDRPFFLALGLFRPHMPFFSPQKYFSEFYQPNPYLLPYRKPYNDPPNAIPPNGIIMAPQLDPTMPDYQNLPYIGKINADGHNEAPEKYFLDYPYTLSPPPVVDPGLSDSARIAIMQESFRANCAIAYMAAIRYVDAQIGRVIDALEAQPGMAENTIIVMFSDHGYALGEKRHWGKVALWDQVTRVPMLVVDPRKPGKKVTYRPINLIDVFPTILELTGTPEPKLGDGSRYLDGESFAYLLDDPEAPRTKPVLVATELTKQYQDGYCFPMHSVFDQRFHYIRYFTNGAEDDAEVCDLVNRRYQEELYEIGMKREVDPNEFFNLADNPDYQSIKEYLAQYLPEGPLYNQSGARVDMQMNELSCVVNLNFDHVVKARFTDGDGAVYTSAPAGFVYEWNSPAFFAPIYGDSVVLGSATVNSALLGTGQRLALTLRVSDTATGVFYQTLEQISVSASNAPTADFSVQFTEPTAVQVELLSEGGSARSRYWEFGDGTTNSETKPAAHRYSRPGTYAIRHEVRYGNNPDSTCFRRREVVIQIDSADFDGQPCTTPLYLFAESIASNNAQLRWEPVFGAVRYEFRARSMKTPGIVWNSGERVENTVKIPGLEPNQQYEYQVRAICTDMATDTSAWSYPLYFNTPTCFSPVNVSVASISSNSAEISWESRSPNILAHEVLARPVSGGAAIRKTVGGVSSTVISPLNPGTTYEYTVRPRCPNSSGGPGQPGPLADIQQFSTLSLRDAQELLEQGISLIPNPASDHIQLNMPAQGGLVRVMDAAGRTVYQHNQADIYLQISVAEWAEGFYLVEWRSRQGQLDRQKLLIQR